jgi:hypothetical protein
MRQTNVDLFPEREWPDEGCGLHPTCLTCPYELCRYDYPGGIEGLLRAERDATIRASKLPAKLIAAQFGVSRETIYRIRSGR